jgi:hypothetical protein
MNLGRRKFSDLGENVRDRTRVEQPDDLTLVSGHKCAQRNLL